MRERLTTTGLKLARRRGVGAQRYRFKAVLAMTAAALMLAACGGGDDFGSSGNLNIGVTVGGQFVSEDPIGFAGDPSNLYRYVGNRPTDRIDPDGLDWKVRRTGQAWVA